MPVWLALFLLLGLGSLAAARYIPGPRFVDALLLCFLFAGLAAGTAIGLLGRQLSRRGWKAPVALILGAAAAAGRFSLLAWLTSRPQRAVAIAVPELVAAVGSVAWGLLALVWGAAAIGEALDPPAWPEPGARRVRRRRQVEGAAAAIAVALALFSLAPLGLLLGLRLNHWTALGLFALAGTAYGVGRLYNLILPRPDR